MIKTITPAYFIVLGLFWTLGFSGSTSGQAVDFNKQIKPLLSDRCFVCHGPDEKTREAGLRLDLKSDLESVVEAGDPDASDLWQRIEAEDEAERMPPPDSHLKLSESEKHLIRKWIEQGANWQQHWSFVRLPRKVPVPARTRWGSHPIDYFVDRTLGLQGLTPQARASREVLIRRLSFDLTGLPPSLEEIDGFLNDASERAYENLVDRLLASKRFGERMASEWLDVARYSDTYGYQVDRDRFVWPWRDWVVRSFNHNQPYDEFLRDQLAGDLLPNATREQILATTFNRLHPQKVEGGSDEEEFRVEYVADRAQTFATGILGLTMECARCHDHKYDPISQKEYYQLFAFFDDIDEAGLYSYFTNSVPTPTLRLTSDEQEKQLRELDAQLEQIESRLKGLEFEAAFEKWITSKPTPTLPKPIKTLDFENYQAGGKNRLVDSPFGKAIELSGDDAVASGVGNFRRDQAFSVSLWIKVPEHKQRAVIFHRSRAWTDAASRGYELLIVDGKLQASLIHFWPGNALSVRSKSIPLNRWIHVVVSYSGIPHQGREALQIYVDGENRFQSVVKNSLSKNITGGGGNQITIGERFRDRGFKNGLVDSFRVYDENLTAVQARQLFQTENPTKQMKEPEPLSKSQWRKHFCQKVHSESKFILAEFRKTLKTKHDLENQLREIMVMKAARQPRQAFLLERGAYDQRGEPVVPGVPTQLTQAVPFPNQGIAESWSRLDLANWIAHPDHPLTSRVAVNRIWQMLFGNGLVRTPEDFGSQGQPPSHPELLDWLARDFVNHDWDTKRLIKQLVMSETYRQKSESSALAREKDPQNRWLSHFPRHRLPAEMIRDNFLAVSGLLNGKQGGAPVKPYEVTQSFKPTNHDQGANLYRRSLYTYWRRTAPAPVMMALDANKRDVCRVQRQRTNSPIAALVLLNDPQSVEACRVIAAKALAQHSDWNRAIPQIFRQATGRSPTEQETRVLSQLYSRMKEKFENDPKSAQELLGVGKFQLDSKLPEAPLAAMALVASTILNLDECVRKY